MKALLPHSPQPNQPQKHPPDYVDPPRVLARRQRILNRWKAEGRPLTQPRMALSLAIARQSERNYGNSHWGYVLHGKAAYALRSDRDNLFPNGARTQALRRSRRALARAQLINPYALPDKPALRSGQTL